MEAIVQTGTESVETQNREVPTPRPNEVLVQVHTAGLCGSDAHAYVYDDGFEWVPIPRIMGHEYSGEVVEVGANITRYEVGDQVVEEPIHDCGDCFQCQNGQPNVCQHFTITGMHTDGAYAEYRTVPAEHLHPVPEAVPLDHAAITEPLSIATRAVFDRSMTTPGNSILVEGPGPIGVFTAVVADELGAQVTVSGIDDDTKYRLPLVESLGIDTLNVEAVDVAKDVARRTDGLGFDVIFDATGHRSGVEMAAEHVRKGGQIVVIGLPGAASQLFMTPLVRGEIEVTASYGSTWGNFEQALQLLQQEVLPIDDILDYSPTIEDPAKAFEAFLAAESCKPVFSFA